MAAIILFLCVVPLTMAEDLSARSLLQQVEQQDETISEVGNCAATMESYDNRIKQYEKMLDKYVEKFDELEKKLEGSSRKDDERRLVLPDEPSVAFYVQLSHDLSGVGNFQTVVFDLVTTNIGNGYDRGDGIFTVPVPGVYVFTWTASNMDATFMQTELVVNASPMGRQWSDSGSHNDVSSATGTVVLRLNMKDTVWVRSNTVHNNRLKGSLLTSFSGWLLYV